jgi:sugar phosphate isomerase/epimerase
MQPDADCVWLPFSWILDPAESFGKAHMRTIKGPSLFIAQFIDADPQLSTLEGLVAFAAGCKFKALQIPTFFPRIFDLEQAAQSQSYCDDILGVLAKHGLTISELTSQRHGQLMAVNPAYDLTLAHFAPESVRHNPTARLDWAERQLRLSATASRRLKLNRLVTFSGSLLWPHFYPYPPAPAGLIDEGFRELVRRWRPVLDACDSEGIDLCFELHPTEDLHDGVTFERFLAMTDNHARCNLLYDPSHFLLQHMDYLGFIDIYHSRIKAFHVKDAEYQMSARSGVYGGYQDWRHRAGRFRSPGDGSIDFKGIFSRLTNYGYDGWATLEWECCFKNRYQGAREGAELIRRHIIAVTDAAFDAPMRHKTPAAEIRSILGTDREPGQ